MADFKHLIRSSENKYSNLYFLQDDPDTSRKLAGVFDVPENETPLVCTTESTSALSLSFEKNVLITESTICIKDKKEHVSHIPIQKLTTPILSLAKDQKKR